MRSSFVHLNEATEKKNLKIMSKAATSTATTTAKLCYESRIMSNVNPNKTENSI